MPNEQYEVMFSDLPDQIRLRGTKVSKFSKRKPELANVP